MNVGAAFGEHVKKEKQSKHFNSGERASLRPIVLLLAVILFPSILLINIFSIQIVHGNYYRNLSDKNRTRTKIIHASRGVIFDRNGKPLVFNIPGFREIKGERTILLTREKALDLLAQGKDDLEIDSLRQYPLKEASAHILGYVGQISKDELSHSQYLAYSATDVIGKTGIEQTYERLLRGVDGKELIEVDAMGKKMRTLGQTDPTPGKDIQITLDADIQQVAYDALKNHTKGAVVVTSPNGELIAMVSKPSYDPNLFTMDESYSSSDSAYKNIHAILGDQNNQPLLNRAIGGVYPPGSTFKLVTAAAGLENKLITKSFVVEDKGKIQIGDFSFGNWYFIEHGKTDGSVNVTKALARSNDIFFYKLAELIKVDRLSDFAKKMGLGQKSSIDLAGEAIGNLPNNEWKQKNLHEPWYLGDTYHYGIGQGYLLTTPLQVNLFTAAIANNGRVPRPHILRYTDEQKPKKEVVNDRVLSQETIAIITEGMVDSCAPGGVAWPLYHFKVKNGTLPIDNKNILKVTPGSESAQLKDIHNYREIPVACKTGTAQVGDEFTEPHAWITLFAPAYDPQLVVTVLVENGGQGSNTAAPVAKKILEAWFSR